MVRSLDRSNRARRTALFAVVYLSLLFCGVHNPVATEAPRAPIPQTLGHEKAQKGPRLFSLACVASIDAAGIRPADNAGQSGIERSSASEKNLRGDSGRPGDPLRHAAEIPPSAYRRNASLRRLASIFGLFVAKSPGPLACLPEARQGGKKMEGKRWKPWLLSSDFLPHIFLPE